MESNFEYHQYYLDLIYDKFEREEIDAVQYEFLTDKIVQWINMESNQNKVKGAKNINWKGML